MMKEIRSNEQIQASQESRRVEGYAVVFESESVDLGGFTEVISRSAISEETIKNSDILCLFDHDRGRGVLARSKKGQGTLNLELDERGLKYSFDAPDTLLGNEVLEGLRRGDFNQCSFAFTVSDDSWVKREDGSVLRTINQIDKLYDVSVVVFPAYEDTYVVNKRGLEELEQKELEQRESEAEVSEDEDEEKKPESEDEKPEDVEEVEEKSCDSEKDSDDEERNDSENDEKDDDSESENDADTKEEERNLYNKENYIITNISMSKKNFSLIDTINDAVNNRSNDFVKNGQIVLPIETRAEGDVTPATPEATTSNGILAGEFEAGGASVPVQLWDLISDLKDRMVISQLGAQFITATGSVLEFPKYSSKNAAWVGEIDHAKDVAGDFSSVKLAPMRLSCYLDISNTWLENTAANAESILRQEIVNCIALKLQQTMFGNGKGSDTEPQGLFYGITSDTADFKFEDAIAMEQALEEANVYGDFHYVASPAAKHYLRTLPVDKGSGKFVMEGNDVLGIPCLSTNSVVSKGLVLGDWSQFVVAMWGNMRMTIDNLTRAVYNQTRICLTMDCNYMARRPEALVKRILK